MQELEGIAEDTGKLPQALANRPLLKHQGLGLYLDMFFELQPHRQYTMGGALPLSYSDKKAMLDEYGYFGEQRRRMMTHLTTLDQVFLGYLRKLAAKDTPESAKNSKR